MIFDYIKFLTENKDNINKGRNQRIIGFKDFNNPNFKFVKSLFGDNKVDDKEVIEKYEEFIEFRKESDYLRKEQKYLPLFFKIKERDGKSDQELRDLYTDIQKHRNTIKQNQIDLTLCEKYEDVVDELIKISLIEKTNKFVKLLPIQLRNGIKSDRKSLERFSRMIMEYSYDDYKNTFLSKVAKYRTLEEFFGALDNHLKSFQDMSKIFRSIENQPGAEVVHSTEDYIIARIYSKTASINLGSQQWCITNRGGSMWDSYISNRNGYGSGDRPRPGVQYFIWDFRYDPSDNKSLIGVTIYTNDKYSAHDKSDNAINVDGNDWFKYVTSFNNLSKNDKVRLVADNIEIEKYTGIVNSLNEKEKRKILKDIPKLLLHFKDLSFLNNGEIWDLVRKDIELSESLPIANELNDEQKIKLVIKNPKLLNKKWENNPYKEITNKLTRPQRIEMISNDLSLYPEFKLSDDETFELINLNPQILVFYTNIMDDVDQSRLKQEYVNDKDHWDNSIAETKGEKKIAVELKLSHIIKDEDRIDMENNNNCLIIVAKSMMKDGKEYLLFDGNKVTYVPDILSVENPKISYAMLMSCFHEDLKGYDAWVPKKLLSEFDSENDYYFKSSMESLINRTTDDEREQLIYDSIMETYSDLPL